MTRKTADDILTEYNRAVGYNTSLNLYEQIKKNENFFIGRQWEGLNAPDLPKPVVNVLKRVVSYFISMIVSDDIGISMTPFSDAEPQIQIVCRVIENEIRRMFEQMTIKSIFRDCIRNAAVDGDACLYFFFDPDTETGQMVKGAIACELIDNTNVLFGNPYSWDVQRQPYILLARRKSVEAVREYAKMRGVLKDQIQNIRPDGDPNEYTINDMTPNSLVTVLTKLWKENGTVHAIEIANDIVLRPEWDLQYRLYPVAYMNWDRVKNSYHGRAAITGLIPNQIAINQLFAMGIHSVKTNAFPRIFYDGTKIKEWTNRIGQAIKTTGDPNQAIATNYRGADMSSQVMQLIEALIQKTLEFMGASDSALGNVDPKNTSAIIATQKASAMPLELQKMAFYQFVEDCVRIMADMAACDYGIREGIFEQDGKKISLPFDFAQIRDANLKLNVDIGEASYWAETVQLQTMDNLFARGVIQDAFTYHEIIPDHYIRGKSKIIEDLKRRQMAQQQTTQPISMMGEA